MLRSRSGDRPDRARPAPGAIPAPARASRSSPRSRLHSGPRRHFATQSTNSWMESTPQLVIRPADAATVAASRLRFVVSGAGTFVADRRSGDSVDSTLVRSHARTRAELESPRVHAPYTAYTAGCEHTVTTLLRTAAHVQYSGRYRSAFGQRPPPIWRSDNTVRDRSLPHALDGNRKRHSLCSHHSPLQPLRGTTTGRRRSTPYRPRAFHGRSRDVSRDNSFSRPRDERLSPVVSSLITRDFRCFNAESTRGRTVHSRGTGANQSG